MTQVLPDDEALLIAALKSKTAVTTLVPGAQIATRLSGTYPAIRVALVGGASRRAENTGQPQLQVECWGAGGGPNDERQASDIARAVESVAPDLAGVYGPGTIAGSFPVGGRIHSPDPTGPRERYITQIGLITQP